MGPKTCSKSLASPSTATPPMYVSSPTLVRPTVTTCALWSLVFQRAPADANSWTVETAGFLIERSPLVNAGETVCTRCEMATVEQADALIAIGEIQCDILCFTTTLTFTQYAEVDKTRGTRTNRSSDRSCMSNTYSKNFGRTRRAASKPNGFLNRAMPKKRVSVEGCGIML